MPAFTSTRERRLWSWALVVLMGIYGAALFAGRLVEALGSEVVVGVAFGLGLVLAVVAVVGMALSRRVRAETWVVLGVVTVYLMIPIRSAVPALERTHLFEYGILAALIYEALAERKTNGSAIRVPGLAAVVAATLFGWLDEALQGLLPTRVYDLRDVGVNALAAGVAVAALAALRWARGRAARESSPRSRE